MGAWEIIIVVSCAALVLGVVIKGIIKRVKGEGGCDCSECKNCCERCNSRR